MPLINGNASSDSNDNLLIKDKPLIAVLPFVNHTLKNRAYSIVMEELYLALDSQMVNYLSHDDIRPTMRRHRIRSVGTISREDVLHITNETEIDRLLLGSINIYNDQMNPEISISARIIDTKTMKVIASVTKSATGKDFEKLFGLGIIETIEPLVHKTVQELIANLTTNKNKQYSQATLKNSRLSVAIIPFDNISENKKAGLVSMNILLSSLINKGYSVIEPGIIENLMSKNKRVLRGEIDYITLNQLRDEYRIDLLITGSIETFELGLGSRQPEIELGIRTLDASNGKIMIMFNDTKKGNESETIFGLGKINAMGNLLKKSFKKYIHTLEKKSEKYFAKQN